MMYVIKKVGFFRRLWHLFLTVVLKVEVTVYGKSDYPPDGSKDSWLEPHWLCPGCLKYQPWTFGAADNEPDLCDNCWCEKVDQMKEELQ